MRQLVYVISLLVFIACSDSTDEALQIDISTGINFKDINGQSVGQAGNPNDNVNGNFFVYPNPSNGLFIVDQLNTSNLELYIIPSSVDTTFKDYDFVNAPWECVTKDIVESAQFNLSTQGASVTIDLSSYPKGFYRLVAVDDQKACQYVSLYIDPNLNPVTIFEDVLALFN